MSKKATNRQDSRRRPPATGSGKHCTWMMAPKWNDCGQPASYSAPWCGGYYCAYHAQFSIGPLTPLSPNTELRDRREDNQ